MSRPMKREEEKKGTMPPPPLQVVLPPEDYAEDLDLRLGRANGNVYHRRPGVEGIHDGQVMVRLKKKRFIIIDYSIVPNESDLKMSEEKDYLACPVGAGTARCITKDCNKIGIPVLLYDSEPHETASLYMRSGLCFTCQRLLNEKRRTHRKRSGGDSTSNMIFALGPTPKKLKQNGEVIELNSDAIILNGVALGARRHGEGYTFHEISTDLQAAAREAAVNVDRLVCAVSSSADTGIETSQMLTDTTTNVGQATAVSATTGPPPTQPPLPAITPTPHAKTENENAMVSAAATAAAMAAAGNAVKALTPSDAATRAAVAATDAMARTSMSVPPPTTTTTPRTPAVAESSEPGADNVNVLYQRTYHSLNRAVYLLAQWKASWDNALAIAQESSNVPTDPSLVDAVASAVASAAAVAAAAATSGHAPTPNMVSLLLAADQSKSSDNNPVETSVVGPPVVAHGAGQEVVSAVDAAATVAAVAAATAVVPDNVHTFEV